MNWELEKLSDFELGKVEAFLTDWIMAAPSNFQEQRTQLDWISNLSDAVEAENQRRIRLLQDADL